jgi:hypothetical protein
MKLASNSKIRLRYTRLFYLVFLLFGAFLTVLLLASLAANLLGIFDAAKLRHFTNWILACVGVWGALMLAGTVLISRLK